MKRMTVIYSLVVLFILPTLATAALYNTVYENQGELDSIRFMIVNDAVGADISFNTFIWTSFPGGEASTWEIDDP